MTKFLIFIIALLSFAPCSFAKLSKVVEADLRSLDPQTRLEQLCDVKAMEVVKADKNGHHDPDRAIGLASKAPKINGNTIIVTGGALRSHGKWHALSYTCTATPDHMNVLKFDYTLGPYIPKSEWDKDGLWN